MRITEITVFSYTAHYSHGSFSMSNGRSSTGHPSLVIRIRTDSGIEGWAENAPLGSSYLPSTYTGELAALEELCPQVLGLDPRTPAVITANLDLAMMSGMAAKSIIDIACWDILGKSVGLPTHVLLGGCVNEAPPAFSVIGIYDTSVAVQKAKEEHAKGTLALQLKIGNDPVADAKRVRAIRLALPDHVYCFADANANWNLAQALVYARALGQDITVPFEQPCRTIADCSKVARLTGLPVILDESIFTVADLVEAHAGGITGVNIKLSRVGGMTKARIMRDTAAALGMSMNVDDTWGCALTTAQNLQIACSTQPSLLGAVDCYAEWTYPMIAEVPRVQQDGQIRPSQLPGNGFGAINMEMLGEPLLHFSE
ncbi:hypothetical protein E8E14_001840 [Neopestalotiopsis sp. 37M]|nr:hypothetical protein E8E14_001840 [Neopestalotiopsis sp. 37M]